ncbi:putative late blight resistance protein homolog R1A-3 [Capsicum annuum]|uniref:putative late blight resistance protein homolog R1A-3 n=1 Tax=Capsicum annuum TaxID=4072 RepID=UPI001FB17E36|nr:putative late blight resistance protein homolog R1A-3 [Capsicum annuum]
MHKTHSKEMAYAALSSLMHTLQKLLQPKSPLICGTSMQQQHAESVHQSVCALQVFLEDATNEVSDIENLKVLEKKIRDVVYKAEDKVDSSLSNIILADNDDDRDRACRLLNQELQVVEMAFDSLKKEVMVVEFNKHGGKSEELTTTSYSLVKNNTEETTFVGMKDDLDAIVNCLNAQMKELIVISVVGMGGIGKTTLARKVFDDSTIRCRFDKHAWVTISEQYNKRKMLLEVASSVGGIINQETSNDRLMEIVYRGLKGRKFLIVIDDIWSTEAWDQVRRIFPNDYNKSRIILTTRLKNVADYASSPDFPPHDVSFLSLDDSWKLFTGRLFRMDPCPLQLVKIGKHIIQQCQGLPLSIVVIAGLLGKIGLTRDNWKKIEENLNSFFGGFPEDLEIRVSKLIRSWIAEQFIKERSNKRLEVVAEEYVQELMDRNLILAGRRKPNGRIKTCKIHDLLRQLCIREAQIENVVHFPYSDVPTYSDDINDRRRVIIPRLIEDYFCDHPRHRNGNITTRSLIFIGGKSYLVSEINQWPDIISHFKLLKVLDAREIGYDFSPIIPQLVHLRYVNARIGDPSSLAKLRNLQTIIIYSKKNVQLPAEIWTMSEIKHVEILDVDMPDPVDAERYLSIGEQQPLFLHNLQTLVLDSSPFLAEILKRTANLDKLKIRCVNQHNEWYAFLDCLILLQRLETLHIKAIEDNGHLVLSRDICLPNLKELRLAWTYLAWEDMTVLANLPNLEVLKTERAFNGTKWILDDDVVFQKLKYLRFEFENLEIWEASSDNFPMLEQLVLWNIEELEEIPQSFGEIMTLKLVEVEYCNPAVDNSAKNIQEEQENWGNYELQIRITPSVKWLASHKADDDREQDDDEDDDSDKADDDREEDDDEDDDSDEDHEANTP